MNSHCHVGGMIFHLNSLNFFKNFSCCVVSRCTIDTKREPAILSLLPLRMLLIYYCLIVAASLLLTALERLARQVNY